MKLKLFKQQNNINVVLYTYVCNSRCHSTFVIFLVPRCVRNHQMYHLAIVDFLIVL